MWWNIALMKMMSTEVLSATEPQAVACADLRTVGAPCATNFHTRFKHAARWVLTLLGPLWLLLLSNCKQQEPVYATDVDLGDERQALLPTGMYFVYGDELMRGRVRDPDLSHLVPPDPEPNADVAGGAELPSEEVAAIRTTLSDALDLMVENEWEEIPSYFVEPQAEQLEKFIPIIKPLVDKSKALEAALGESRRNVGTGAVPAGMPGDPKAMMAALKPMLDAASISASDATHAAMQLNLPMLGGAFELPFAKIEDEWFIEIPNFPPVEVLDQIRSTVEGVLPGILQKMDELIARAEKEPITPQQVQLEMMQAMMPVQQSILQAFVQTNLPEAEKTEGDPSGAPAPKEGDDEPVDVGGADQEPGEGEP